MHLTVLMKLQNICKKKKKEVSENVFIINFLLAYITQEKTCPHNPVTLKVYILLDLIVVCSFPEDQWLFVCFVMVYESLSSEAHTDNYGHYEKWKTLFDGHKGDTLH